MTQPPLTPAEIETLRKFVNGEHDREVDYAAIIYANKILDRLTPAPEPEVDEATKVYNEMFLRRSECMENGSLEDARIAAISYLREFIVAKDAERDRLLEALRITEDQRVDERDRYLIAESELATLRARIASLFDAVSHGDDEHKSWLKQAIADHFAGKRTQTPRGQNSAEVIATLRAENEWLKGDAIPPEGYKNLHIAARDCVFDANKLGRIEDGWLLLENVNVSVASKAAERNPAEPEPFNRPTDPPEEVWNEWVPATNTAGVEVQQVDVILSTDNYKQLIASAEARGRREALEKTDDEWKQIARAVISASICGHDEWHVDDAAAELKRMMTEVK